MSTSTKVILPTKSHAVDKSKKKEPITFTLYFTEQQHTHLMELGKKMGADDIEDFINRCIQLGKIVGGALDKDCELILVDPALVDVLEKPRANPKKGGSKVVTALIEKPEGGGICFLTEKVKEAVQYTSEIKNSNNWGTGVDGLPC